MGRKSKLPGLRVKDGYLRHPFDIEYQVETSGLVHGRNLKTGHPNDRHNTAYYAVAPSVFLGLRDLWWSLPRPAPLAQYTFLDFGAGMGRATLLAATMPFRQVIAIELHPALADMARKNCALWQIQGRAKSPIRVVCADATDFVFPETPCLAFLFNPFRAPVLRALLKSIERSFRDRPGHFDLLYANHEMEAVLHNRPGWQRLWTGNIPLSPQDEQADRQILNHQPDGEYASSTEEPCSIYRWLGHDRAASP